MKILSINNFRNTSLTPLMIKTPQEKVKENPRRRKMIQVMITLIAMTTQIVTAIQTQTATQTHLDQEVIALTKRLQRRRLKLRQRLTLQVIVTLALQTLIQVALQVIQIVHLMIVIVKILLSRRMKRKVSLLQMERNYLLSMLSWH